ncbi:MULTISPECIES: thioredoxin-dependent thiol peroxidase [Segatella]|uniref:thioredoxin-dependent peroxiredoxin n=2 Tax=Segatella TaxID=2974251 RepID=D8DZ90_9BACT|nr:MULTISPECIES: thioredoxin-dependent thiol peroxidase [Segatella]EFI71246.1 bacterioferritin comigratory protein [Segatella baroniae B14]UKK77477.1 thioredoxin-dependent thiol peroxidase [Segatella baroniae B14]GJG26358.1 peroxiredoxin [Segatella bryantii]SEP55036.1 peroxiredoxin Q/BCP [Segatella baroniae B14]
MEIGQKLPEFLGIDQDGKEWKTSDLAGKKIVLYFYPKDSTPGCTNEACNLRDNYERFLALGYVVLGVSIQDAKSHKKFIEKYNLPFSLLCDTEKKLVEEMGVWGEKKMAGRTYMGTFRTTFIADEEGTIIQIFGPKQIKVKEHAEQILK